jgi:elongator complex protein 1
MSSSGRLYCNDFQVADTISSFAITSENQFLSFATSGSSCILRFIPLLDLINFDPLLGSDENSILLGYEPRNIERGSLLVSVLTKKPSVVLQMTRGNLEVIHPRALVLRHSMLKTMDQNYDEAFQLMRRQKVDLNLIVDMNPNHFLNSGGVDTFIEQVENIDYLNLFISCLQDWDSTKERYPIPYWIKPIHSAIEDEASIDFSSKVNLVCRRMRSVMIKAQEEGSTKACRAISEDHFPHPIHFCERKSS